MEEKIGTTVTVWACVALLGKMVVVGGPQQSLKALTDFDQLKKGFLTDSSASQAEKFCTEYITKPPDPQS